MIVDQTDPQFNRCQEPSKGECGLDVFSAQGVRLHRGRFLQITVDIDW